MPDQSGLPARDDEDLVHDAQDGNRESFGVLCERYHALLMTLVAWMLKGWPSAWSIAEDLVQDTWSAAWKGLAQYKRQSFKAWICEIARNKARTYRRRNPRRDTVQIADIDIPCPESAQESTGEKQLASTKVLEWIEAHRSTRDRKLVEARVLMGLSFRQIALELGFPTEGAARQQFFRIRGAAREQFPGLCGPDDELGAGE